MKLSIIVLFALIASSHSSTSIAIFYLVWAQPNYQENSWRARVVVWRYFITLLRNLWILWRNYLHLRRWSWWIKCRLINRFRAVDWRLRPTRRLLWGNYKCLWRTTWGVGKVAQEWWCPKSRTLGGRRIHQNIRRWSGNGFVPWKFWRTENTWNQEIEQKAQEINKKENN